MRQLAAQIGRSIELTLVGECRDEVLQNMSVASVEPSAGNRMLVTLTVHPPGSELAREDVMARLEAQRALILDRVMQDVTRRSLPELSFWVVKESADGAGERPEPGE
jgi:ribosome-binding factor A